MTYTRWFVSGLFLIVLSLQACGVLQTTPSDATLTNTCSKPSANHSLHAQGAMPSSGGNSMSGSGFP
jgi:hypothetical protein